VSERDVGSGGLDHNPIMPYRIISTRKARRQTMQVVSFSIPKTSVQRRSKMLTEVLERSGAVAMIELINPTGIVRKPMWRFNAILVFNN
jgi:hypothetical protein